MAPDLLDGSGNVTGGKRVADRLVRRPGLPVPVAGALVQGGHGIGLGSGKLTAQHLGEEVVIAEPLPILVKWHDEEVLAVQHLDDLARVGRSDDGVAQRRTESAENRGPGEKLRSEEHTSELQSRPQLVCRLLLEK